MVAMSWVTVCYSSSTTGRLVLYNIVGTWLPYGGVSHLSDPKYEMNPRPIGATTSRFGREVVSVTRARKSPPGDSAKGYVEGGVRHELPSDRRTSLAVSTSVDSFSLAFQLGKIVLPMMYAEPAVSRTTLLIKSIWPTSFS